MSKVQIDLPSKFIFETEIPVRISDINYGNHLGNDSVLSIVHEARVRFLKSMGFTEKDVDGPGIIMIDAAVQYKSEGFYGDVIKFEIGINDLTKSGCDIVYKLSNKETSKLIAIVKTGIVFFDYKNRKVVQVPDKFMQEINNI
jgi:acyl-CoA thioesterase FadM